MKRLEKVQQFAWPACAAGVLGGAVVTSGLFSDGIGGFISGICGLIGIGLSGMVWAAPGDRGGTRGRIVWTVVYALIVMEFLRRLSLLLWPAGVLYLATFYVAAALVIHFVRPKAGLFGVAVLALAGFVRIELLAGPGRIIFQKGGALVPAAAGLAFPFGDPVYALSAFPPLYRAARLAGTIPLVLGYGAVGYLILAALRERRAKALITAAAVMVIALLLGRVAAGNGTGPCRAIPVLVCQGNVHVDKLEELPPSDRAGEDPLIAHYRRLTEKSLQEHPETQLVIWPESSWPGLIDARGPTYPEWLGGRTLIAAGYSYRRAGDNQLAGNAALILTPTNSKSRDKVVLTPFGEYAPRPFGRIARAREQDAWEGDLTPGEWPRQPVEVEGMKLGTLVCYEDAFPGRLAAEAGCGAEAVVVVTNDGWFRGTSEPWQHAAALRVRAVEAGLAAVRAGNVAPSFIADAAGRITARLPEPVGVIASKLAVRKETKPSDFVHKRPAPTGLGGWLIAAALAAVMMLEGLRTAGK